MSFQNHYFTNCRDLRLGMPSEDLLLVVKQTTLQLFEIFEPESQIHTWYIVSELIRSDYIIFYQSSSDPIIL